MISSKNGVLLVSILGSSMAYIDSTAMNVILPVFQMELNAKISQVLWIVEAYALFVASLLLLAGALGDHFGRKRIFKIGVIIFSLSSLWCGLSPNIHHLITARCLQGLGGALLIPGSLAIITSTFSEETRGKAIGTWAAFTALMTALGPLLGGWLVENLSWRWVFYINIPLSVIVLITLDKYVVESKNGSKNRSIDIFGGILVTLGLGGIVFGLIESSNHGFKDLMIILPLTLGILLLISFVIYQKNIVNPLIPLNLFKNKEFAGSNLSTFFLYAALGGATFFVPFNLIQVQGYSPTQAGAAFLPMLLILFSLSRWSGGLVDKFGARKPLVIGPIISSIGYLIIAFADLSKELYWFRLFPGICVLGLGMTITIAPLTTAVMNSVNISYAGVASGINNFVGRISGVLAIAVFGLVIFSSFNSLFYKELNRFNINAEERVLIEQQRTQLAAITLPDTLDKDMSEKLTRKIKSSYISSFRLVLLIISTLAMLSSVIAYYTIPNKEESGNTS